MIKLLDILNIKESDYKDYKIHFAIGAKRKEEPRDFYYSGTFEDWQAHQNNKNFNRPYVLSLIWISENKWLYGGVYRVIGNPDFNGTYYRYNLELMDVQKDLIGRIVVDYKKEYRASYPSLELIPKNGQVPKDMVVSEILGTKQTVNDFLGFDLVNISYDVLRTIVNKGIPSWKNALSKAKGVYLIVDAKTGKQYVGSAYGDNCIWDRWSSYVKTGDGGNKELKDLLTKYGDDYKKNFKYSILEVCNMNLGSEYIIGRETYWKEVLLTRKFGLNCN